MSKHGTRRYRIWDLLHGPPPDDATMNKPLFLEDGEDAPKDDHPGVEYVSREEWERRAALMRQQIAERRAQRRKKRSAA